MNLMAQTFATFEEAAEAQKKYTPIFLGGFKDLSSQEDTIRFTGVFYGQTSNGKKFAWLEDELVVIEKITKKITRIYLCGNIGRFTPFYKKSTESVILLSQLSSYLKTIQTKGEKGDKGDPGENGRDGRDARDWGLEENKSSFWTDWGAPIVGGLLTGIATGYAFPEENETTTQIITPGTKVQTSNGTFVYGPEKIKMDVHTEKSFSWKNAGLGFLAGGITIKIALN